MTFDEWFNQQEGYSTRAERFYEDLEWNDPQRIKDWLMAAYNEGMREANSKRYSPDPVFPTWPNTPNPWRMETKCSKCGIDLTGVMGYVCSNSQCPTFPRIWSGITTSVNAQSYNVSNTFGTKSDEGYNG